MLFSILVTNLQDGATRAAREPEIFLIFWHIDLHDFFEGDIPWGYSPPRPNFQTFWEPLGKTVLKETRKV